MATASAAAKATAPKPTKAQKEAALRLKQAQRAANLLKQVSDPTRLQIILMLAEGEKHVGALGEHLNQSQPAVSHHLALMRVSGLIEARREAKHNFYSIRTDAFGEMLESLFTVTGEVPKKVKFHDFTLTSSGR